MLPLYSRKWSKKWRLVQLVSHSYFTGGHRSCHCIIVLFLFSPIAASSPSVPCCHPRHSPGTGIIANNSVEQPLSPLCLYSIENNYSPTLIGVTAFYWSIQTLPLTINNERQQELVILVLAGRHAHSTEGTLHLTSLFTLKMIFFFIAYIKKGEKKNTYCRMQSPRMWN